MVPGLVRALVIVVSVVAVVVALLWLFQRRLIYLPDTSAVPAADEVLPAAQDVTLMTSDGLDLGAWYVPAGDGRRDVTVMVANGNGGNRAGRAPLAAELAAVGFDVLLFDYRGYGGNPGNPSSDGLVRDARAALTYLVDEAAVPADRVIYFGESLGAGVVTALAHSDPPAGLLLRSPFESLAAVGQHHYPFLPVGLLLRDEFPVASLVAGIDVPTTVVYGSQDTIIPPDQSRAVADAAAGDVDVVEIDGAGHNDEVMFTGRELIAAVEALADRSVGPAAP
jgi:pimeloyl-ACP methyl ester carboxylesterase